MADLTTPIDIRQIQATADKKRSEIKRMLTQNIRSVLGKLKNIKGIQSKVDLLSFTEGDGAMPYDPDLGNWTKLGEIKKREAAVKVGMLPVKDEIERYRDTYMVTLEDLNLNEKKLPFAQWYLETYTIVGLNSLHKVPYQGVHNPTGTNAVDICDGYFKIIEDEKAAAEPGISVPLGNMYELSGGATDYTAVNIGDELLAQYHSFPEVTQELADEIEIRIPYRYRKVYREWLKSEYPNMSPKDLDLNTLEGTDGKGKFIWESAMGTSRKVIMNVPGVLTYETDKDNKEFGKPKVFHPNNNPFLIALVNKIVIGFQIYSLDPRVINVNNL